MKKNFDKYEVEKNIESIRKSVKEGVKNSKKWRENWQPKLELQSKHLIIIKWWVLLLTAVEIIKLIG